MCISYLKVKASGKYAAVLSNTTLKKYQIPLSKKHYFHTAFISVVT